MERIGVIFFFFFLMNEGGALKTFSVELVFSFAFAGQRKSSAAFHFKFVVIGGLN